MISKVYNLPEISFVGGETHDLRFHLFTDTGRVFNASGAKATFSIVYSVNRTGAPVLSKAMSVIADDDGIESILAVTLLQKRPSICTGSTSTRLRSKTCLGKRISQARVFWESLITLIKR